MTSTISSEKQLRKLELLEQIKLLENEGEEAPPDPPGLGPHTPSAITLSCFGFCITCGVVSSSLRSSNISIF